jgi:hypothetical protein
MSPEIELIIRPDRTYAALAASAAPIGVVRALRRPLLVAVVIGTSMALSTTRHLTPALVFDTTLLLSGVVVVQVLIALAVTGGPASRRVGRACALDLFFASHAPWSLWLLASAVWVPSWFALRAAPMNYAAVAPLVLTGRMIAAYFREVQGLDRRRAAIRTVLHQGVTWSLFVALFGVAVAFWPRILAALS